MTGPADWLDDLEPLTLDPTEPLEAALILLVATARRKRGDYTAPDAGPFWNFQQAAAQAGLATAQVLEVFIATKQARLAALTASGREPANEAIDDTVLDRAVYAALAVAWRRLRV